MKSFHPTAVCLVVLCLTLFLFATHAAADQVTIIASKDNSIFQNSPTNSAGAAGGIFVGANGNTSPRRGLVAFDIASNIPAGATIDSATVTLYLGQAPSTTLRSIELHRLNVNWGEGTAGTGSAIGGSGNGFSPAAGGATWNEGMPGIPWTAGGDFVATASASVSVGNTIDVPSVWASTPSLVSDVQNWLTNPASNFGWELVNAGESTSQTVKAFYSREATQVGFRPSLTIAYTVPEPAAAALFGCASAVAMLFRRRSWCA